MTKPFDNAKFGDRFQTRNGKLAIYFSRHEDRHKLILEEREFIKCDDMGLCSHLNILLPDYDIVGEWEIITPYNEKRAFDLAADFISNIAKFHITSDRMEAAYRVGYRRGFEEAQGYKEGTSASAILDCNCEEIKEGDEVLIAFPGSCFVSSAQIINKENELQLALGDGLFMSLRKAQKDDWTLKKTRR